MDYSKKSDQDTCKSSGEKSITHKGNFHSNKIFFNSLFSFGGDWLLNIIHITKFLLLS